MPQDTPRLPFEIDDTIDPTLVTGRAGVPLVIELFRQLGVAQTIETHVAVKQRQRGLPPSQLVESLIALWASGGDRCQDLAMLREDQALATLLGHALPAATTMRDVLEAFHGEGGPLWAAGPQATIPLESAPLAGLGTANRTLVAGLQRGARETISSATARSRRAAGTCACCNRPWATCPRGSRRLPCAPTAHSTRLPCSGGARRERSRTPSAPTCPRNSRPRSRVSPNRPGRSSARSRR